MGIYTQRQAEVLEALEACNGNKTAAAKRLGMSRRTLRGHLARALRFGEERRKQGLAQAAPPDGWQPVRIVSDRDGNVTSVRSVPETITLDEQPPGHLIKGVSTLLDGSGTVRAQWVKTRLEDQEKWDLFWKAAKQHAEEYRGLAFPQPAPMVSDSETCTIYPLGDPHIGLLSWEKETGENYDLKEAVRVFNTGLDALVQRAPTSRKAVLVNLGDYWHAENDKQVTPKSGHKLDVDSRKGKVTRVGFDLIRSMVDRLLTHHMEVYIINVRGNHDPEQALMLALWLEAVYENEPRVHVLPAENPYVYFEFGKSLVGVHHGDGCKADHLPILMAADEPEAWGRTKYHYWLTGHIHHLTRKEYPGCIVESFRTMAARDYFAQHGGYRSGRSMEAMVLHREFGEFARYTVDIRQLIGND